MMNLIRHPVVTVVAHTPPIEGMTSPTPNKEKPRNITRTEAIRNPTNKMTIMQRRGRLPTTIMAMVRKRPRPTTMKPTKEALKEGRTSKRTRQEEEPKQTRAKTNTWKSTLVQMVIIGITKIPKAMADKGVKETRITIILLADIKEIQMNTVRNKRGL